MSTFSRSGRYLAAVIAICGTAFLGLLSTGWAAAQPLNRPPVAKLVGTTQGALQNGPLLAHESRVVVRERNHLRELAKRACATHRRALCTSARARLVRIDAQSSRFRSHAHTTSPVRSGTTGSTTSGSSGTSTASGSGASSGAAGSSTGATGSSTGTAGSSTGTAGSSSTSGGASSKSEPPSSTVAFQPGINSGSNMTLDVQAASLLGAKLVRIAFPIETVPSEMETVIAGYAAQGIRVLPLAVFDGTLPTPTQAQALASWARTYGAGGSFWAGRSGTQLPIQSIEFGNETSYGYQYGDSAGERSYQERAENYARRFKEAAVAISSTGIDVGLLAQDDDWTGDWMNGMYAAVPDLSKYVAGWTIHPYHRWRPRMEALLEQTAAHGAPRSIPIDVTEFGLPTDNGNCLGEDEEYNGCMSYTEAANTLQSTVSEMRQLLNGELGMFLLYQVRDQRGTGTSTDDEYFYGALQHELQPKGAFTTACQKLLASS
jgi:hypothetical protein